MTLSKPPKPGLWLRIADLTTRRAQRVLMIAGAVAAISLVSASTLRPVASIEAMLADDEPAAIALKKISDNFSGLDELLLLVSLPTPPDTATGPLPNGAGTLLAFANRFSETVSSTPELSRLCTSVQYRPDPDLRAFVESVIIANAVYYLDDDALRGLHDRLTPAQMSEQLRRTEESIALPGAGGGALGKSALKDPLGLRDFLVDALPRPGQSSTNPIQNDDGFFSSDRTSLLIRLRGTAPSSDLDFADAFTKAMTLASDSVNDDGLDLAFAGAHAIAAAAQHSIRNDMIKSIVLSIIFLHVLYFVVYGSIWTLPGALLPVGLGILLAMGLFAAFGMSLTPITGVIGAILAGLGIDYAIHCLSHYHADRASGLTHDKALRHTLPDVGPAMVAACATTVTGFLAISQSSVRALREFGLLGAMGLVSALLATIFVLPAILKVTTGRPGRSTPTRPASKQRFTRLLYHVVQRRKFYLIGSVSLGVVVLGATLVSAQRASMFESDLTVMHPRPNPPLETQHRLSELFQASPDSLLIHMHAESAEELTILAHQTKERLALIDPQQTPIVGSFGLADLLPNPQGSASRQVSLAAFDTTAILADFESALQDSAFNPNAFDPYKVFLQRLFDPREPPGMTQLLDYPGASEMVLPTRGERGQGFEAITAVINREPLADRHTRDTVIETIRSALEGLPGATLTGIAVLGYDTERVIRRDLTRLLGFAGTLVILGLVGYFRSVRAALLAMTPGAFGLVILAGCMYLFELRLNTMNLIALPLLVGIGVDDGIFLVTIARAARGRDGANLINKLSAACHAVSMTSLTTMLTFGTLAFTSTPAIRSLGILMFMGVMASLVGAVALLVPLLTRGVASADHP